MDWYRKWRQRRLQKQLEAWIGMTLVLIWEGDSLFDEAQRRGDEEIKRSVIARQHEMRNALSETETAFKEWVNGPND